VAAGQDRADVTLRLTALENEFEQERTRLVAAATGVRLTEDKQRRGSRRRKSSTRRLRTRLRVDLSSRQRVSLPPERSFRTLPPPTRLFPHPAREVTDDEVIAARRACDDLLRVLEEHEHAIDQARNAVGQSPASG
jgi:hypothetical protein